MKNLLIIQNGGYGDLMFIMPIALWYSERGQEIPNNADFCGQQETKPFKKCKEKN